MTETDNVKENENDVFSDSSFPLLGKLRDDLPAVVAELVKGMNEYRDASSRLKISATINSLLEVIKCDTIYPDNVHKGGSASFIMGGEREIA